MHAGSSTDSRDIVLARGYRRVLGIGFVVVLVLLQVAVQFLTSHDRSRAVTQLVYLSVELPVLMGALSIGYRWAMRRRLGSFAMLCLGVLTAGCIGAMFGALIWRLSQSFPMLRFHAGSSIQLTRAIAFSTTFGQLHFGLWALAFVFPFAVDGARLRAFEVEKHRIEAEQLRSKAELVTLRANLEPHFLLNTLNAIAGLVVEDPTEARRLLVCLGDLLRDALHDEAELQPLEKQVDWLRRYAEVLEARYPKAVHFSWEVEPAAGNALIPRLLLQPLVENAVKHGALRRSQGEGHICVRASLVHDATANTDRLVCSIGDNGPGFQGPARDAAFGLRAVRRRLELKYGALGALHIESSAAGTCATVELPLASREFGARTAL